MNRLTSIVAAALVSMAAVLPAVSQEISSPPTDVQILEFTGPDEGFPPQLLGATDVRLIESEPVLTGLTPALTARLGELAANSPLVQRSLGDRYGFIEAVLFEDQKADDKRPAEQRVVAAIFYSYSRNVAVRALVRGGEVLEVADLEGYQPPESSEEIDRATALAREDTALREVVGDLEARGLLTELGEGQVGSGNRVLYMSFLAPGSALTEYFALVDMTEERVIEAGRAAGN
ncbi:MAG: hypothetical protein WCS20_16500 [Alphaproteobacteria bacterium]